jgi:hypothetical protein
MQRLKLTRIKEMKTKLWITATMLVASLYSTMASAEFVIGVKGGTVDYDAPHASTDAGLNGSIQAAFDIFDIGIADIALEGEYSTSLTDAEIANQDTSLNTTGLYASLRTAGPVYVIARVGYAKTKIEIDGVGSDDDTGVATGLGVGFSLGLRMELEYTKYTHEFEDPFGDVDIKYLTLGFAF